MKQKPFVPILLGVLVAALALGGCAKKTEQPRLAKNQMPSSESHLALMLDQNAYGFVYSDSIVSSIAPLFSSSPNNGCAWVQVSAGPPTSFTLQSVQSVFSSAYPQGQVRVMYATADTSATGSVPYDTSWQLAVKASTIFPPSFRDVIVAQYQTTAGGPWTPFDRVTVTDTAYNPIPNVMQYAITTPGEYYLNFITKDNATAAATCAISIP